MGGGVAAGVIVIALLVGAGLWFKWARRQAGGLKKSESVDPEDKLPEGSVPAGAAAGRYLGEWSSSLFSRRTVEVY